MDWRDGSVADWFKLSLFYPGCVADEENRLHQAIFWLHMSTRSHTYTDKINKHPVRMPKKESSGTPVSRETITEIKSKGQFYLDFETEH